MARTHSNSSSCHVWLQNQRVPETRAAKAHVTKPGLSFKFHQINLMGSPARLGAITVNTRHIGMALKTKFSKHRQKQTILLKAVTATLPQ